ncbi:MAG TPA: phosphatase [Cytophagaceae bacterium]
MKLAAVDIGSNAIRFQISSVLNYNGTITFKKMEYVRFPLRLGHDVFQYNEIRPEKEAKFIKLLHTFKMFFELYEVDDYIICATSAMRESKNGRDIAQKVKDQLGLNIQIIDGEKEAELINKVIFNYLDEKAYLHIDVGGGSTEINIFLNKKKVATNSFKIGSVRRLGGVDTPEEWTELKEWISKAVKGIPKPITAIGTGGNISKIYDLAKVSKSKSEKALININKIEEVQSMLKSFTLEERMNKLMLNPDRADVILPASDIYLSAMKWAGAKKMLVPDVGLKDGLMLSLYEKHKQEILSESNLVLRNSKTI